MKKRVFLDEMHTAVIDINEANKTVVAELETDGEIELVYAEKFNEKCNYEKEALKSVIAYLKGSIEVPLLKNYVSNFVSIMLLAVCFGFW